MKENSCSTSFSDSLQNFPVYILQFMNDSSGRNVSLQKILECNDEGLFPHTNPCVLLLKDRHYFNVW